MAHVRLIVRRDLGDVKKMTTFAKFILSKNGLSFHESTQDINTNEKITKK
jgi:hypothetical protein